VDDKDTGFNHAALRTSVLDTYAMCAALMTVFSASLYFVDVRKPGDVTTSMKGSMRMLQSRYVMQQLHLLLVQVCSALGLQSLLIFLLSSMYAKNALTRLDPRMGRRVYDHVIDKTSTSRRIAFFSMVTCAIGLSFSLSLTCLSVPSFISQTSIPHIVLDILAMCATVAIVGISVVTVYCTVQIMWVASIIFVPDKDLDMQLLYAGEESPLAGWLPHRGSTATV